MSRCHSPEVAGKVKKCTELLRSLDGQEKSPVDLPPGLSPNQDGDFQHSLFFWEVKTNHLGETITM